eukprot:scaffold4498_cov146-Skeletonema_menzelii.AAC.2
MNTTMMNESSVSTDMPSHTDVFLGRGVGINRRPGNIYFGDVVSQHVEEYLTSSKTHKIEISRRVIDHIHALNPPGRFLEKDEATGRWRECEMKRAHEKTAQALRDGAARLRATNKRPTISFAQLSRPAKKQRSDIGVDLDDITTVSSAERVAINLPMKDEEIEVLDIDNLIMHSPIFSWTISVGSAVVNPPCPISPCPSASSSSTQSPVTFTHGDDIDDMFGGLPFHLVDCNCLENENYKDAPTEMVDMQDEDIVLLWLTC